VLLQACLSNPHCLSYTVWGFSENHSWIPGVFTTEGNGTIYDANYQPHKSFRTLQGDLAFAGPPLVQPRIPQKPKR
jgi:endo-1,4-beta-xylanase